MKIHQSFSHIKAPEVQAHNIYIVPLCNKDPNMKAVIGLLILCGAYSTHSASLNAPQSSPCNGQVDGLFLPVHGDCSSFYVCLDGEESLLSCGVDIHFDPVTKTCIEASKSTCVNEVRSDTPKSEPENPVAQKSICAGKAIGAFVPSKTSCSVYYVCMGTNPMLKKCPVGFHFFPETRSCIEEELSTCVIKDKETSEVQEKENSKPVKGEEKENPKPVEAEEKEISKPVKAEEKDIPKPAKLEEKENAKPVKAEEKEIPKPKENAKPVKAEEKEIPKPVQAEEKEIPKPANLEEKENPKPVQAEEKEILKPVQAEEKEIPKPAKPEEKENPKPVKAEEKEIPKPAKLEEKENPKPVKAEEKEIPKPAKLEEKENPKPVKAEEKEIPKPAKPEEKENPKPVKAEEKEIPKPVQAEEKEIPKPVKLEEEQIPKPVQAEEKEISKPVKLEEEQIPKPVQAEKKDNPKLINPSLTTILAERVCLGQANGAMFRIPGSCSKYFSCLNNRAYEKTCGPRHFDPSRKACIKPGSSTCIEDVVAEDEEEAAEGITRAESDLVNETVLNEHQEIDNENSIKDVVPDVDSSQENVKSLESQNVSADSLEVEEKQDTSDANSDTNANTHTISEGKLMINNKILRIKKTGLPVYKKAVAVVENVDGDVSGGGVVINTAGVHSNHGSARDAKMEEDSVSGKGKGIYIGSSNVDLSKTGDISDVNIVSGSNSVVPKNSNEAQNTEAQKAYIEVAQIEPEEVQEEEVEPEEAHIESEEANVEPEEDPIVEENTELVIAVIAEDSADACAGITSGSLLPKVGSCPEFVTCENGVAYIGKCPRGLHFNPSAKFCDWPEKAGVCLKYK